MYFRREGVEAEKTVVYQVAILIVQMREDGLHTMLVVKMWGSRWILKTFQG